MYLNSGLRQSGDRSRQEVITGRSGRTVWLARASTEWSKMVTVPGTRPEPMPFLEPMSDREAARPRRSSGPAGSKYGRECRVDPQVERMTKEYQDVSRMLKEGVWAAELTLQAAYSIAPQATPTLNSTYQHAHLRVHFPGDSL